MAANLHMFLGKLEVKSKINQLQKVSIWHYNPSVFFFEKKNHMGLWDPTRAPEGSFFFLNGNNNNYIETRKLPQQLGRAGSQIHSIVLKN